MYDNPACSRMIEAPKPGFTKLFCEGRSSLTDDMAYYAFC
jgi:hypothetical protein